LYEINGYKIVGNHFIMATRIEDVSQFLYVYLTWMEMYNEWKIKSPSAPQYTLQKKRLRYDLCPDTVCSLLYKDVTV